jgi:uncharacterized membrane protein (Fun14 family)
MGEETQQKQPDDFASASYTQEKYEASYKGMVWEKMVGPVGFVAGLIATKFFGLTALVITIVIFALVWLLQIARRAGKR